jgi:hypothetical protein
MTEIYEQAVNSAINFQAKKDSFKQVQNGDLKITLTIAANELPIEFMQAEMGQIYTVVMVATDEGEEPIKIAEKPKNNNVAQAVMLCKDSDYQTYVNRVMPEEYRDNLNCFRGSNELAAVAVMRHLVEIESRSEVAEGEAAIRFKDHVYEFNEWRRGR